MSRLVVVSGLTVGKKDAERIGEALGPVYPDGQDSFTLAEVLKDPDPFLKVSKGKGVHIVGDSMGGRFALREGSKEGAKWDGIITCGTPLSNTRPHYIKGAALTCWDALTKSSERKVDEAGERPNPLFMGARVVRELVSAPFEHGREVLNTSYDSIDDAIAARQAGRLVSMVYPRNDHYSKPSNSQKKRTAAHDVEIVEIDGDHFALMLDPVEFFGNFVRQSRHFADLAPKVSQIETQKALHTQLASLRLVPSEQSAM
jgi:hypothetical protein